MHTLRFERRGKPRIAPWRVSTLVLLLALSLIILASASLFYVGHVASRAADAQARENDLRLFDNALLDRQYLMARDQLGLARWDRAFTNIQTKFNRGFLEDELADSLWSDFAHDEVFLVAPNKILRMAAKQDDVSFPDSVLGENDLLYRVTENAIAKFMSNRIEIAGGFAQKQVTLTQAMNIAVFAFGHIGKQPALLSAMAIVPEDGSTIAMPDAPPHILISAKYLADDFIKELNAHLGFENLTFHEGDADGNKAIFAANGQRMGTFTWRSARPGEHIWSIVIPVILLLASALTLSALLIARRIRAISMRLEESEANNRQLALHDPLTGLANRLKFTQAIAGATQHLPMKPFAVIACDLDRFKAVNDTYGHAGGDTVIKAVAMRLRTCVGDAGLVSRTGGDEFVILVTAFTDDRRLKSLCQRIIAQICEPITLDDGSITDVGTSLGIAIAPADGMSAETMMVSADKALYAAKEAGRGIAVFAESVVRTGAVEPESPVRYHDAHAA